MTHNDYLINSQDVIGIGCSQVVQATNRITGAPAAAKILDLSGPCIQEMMSVFYNEAYLLNQLNELQCANIVKLNCSSINNQRGFLIMEKMDGDLLDLILEETLTLPQKMNIFKQICFGLKQCHDNGIAHLDIKPENILVNDVGGSYLAKITDFGTSQTCKRNNIVHDVKGTIHYNAPEVLMQSIDGVDGKQADIWSLGILLHVLLTGTWPIQTNDPAELRQLLAKGKLRLSSSLSKDQLIFLSSLLNVNPDHRPTIDQILNCQFVSPTKERKQIRREKSRRGFLRHFLNLTKSR